MSSDCLAAVPADGSPAAAPAAAAPAVLGLPAAAGRSSVVEAQRLAAAEGGTLPPSQVPVSVGTTSHDEEGEPSAGTAAKQSDDMEKPRLPSRFVPAVAAGGAGAGSPGLAQARTFPASAAAAPAAAAPAVLGLPAAAGRPSVVEAQRLAAAEGGTLPPSQVPVSVGGGMPRRTRAATQPNP